MCENLHYFTIQSLNLSQINEEVGHETKIGSVFYSIPPEMDAYSDKF